LYVILVVLSLLVLVAKQLGSFLVFLLSLAADEEVEVARSTRYSMGWGG
jgi:hypothetical protein